MSELFRKQLEESGAVMITGRALSVLPMDGTFGVAVGSDYYMAGALIIAAGITREKLYPGEGEFLGRGVSYCATCDGMLYRGRPVAVLGYSDTARREAEFLEGIGCSVTYFDKPKACEIAGVEQVTRVVCDGVTADVDGVFILRPTMAPTEIFPGMEVENGYVVVDRKMRTNLPGVFAAGDCTGGPLQVSKAVGEGLVAAHTAATEWDTVSV
jgi:thioredoxin reductase (NADPH)